MTVKHIISIFAGLALIFMPQPVSAQTKRALVIGLGQQADAAWGKINGDKDVPYVKEMLTNADFDTITTLVNSRATKAAIVDAFKSLIAAGKPGDIVYVHYSGHGQQMKDMGNDEPDALDECWIPYDAYRKPCANDRGEKHLVDDEVNAYLNQLRNRVGDGGKILVVVDACHSGGATRGEHDAPVRGVEDIFEAVKSYLFSTPEKKQTQAANPKARPLAERWITVSACESNQVNFEMKKPAVGKLTYALYKKARENAGACNDAFFRALSIFINSNTAGRPQRPVISGDKNWFRITDVLQ